MVVVLSQQRDGASGVHSVLTAAVGTVGKDVGSSASRFPSSLIKIQEARTKNKQKQKPLLLGSVDVLSRRNCGEYSRDDEGRRESEVVQ
eukprot:scaffold3549_cov110-Skeletonema_dohrnii-CCMP3373.AAC.16